MAVPIGFIAFGAGTAAIGIGTSIKAGVDQREANDTNSSARNIIKEASEEMEFCRKNCGESINKLATCKIQILDGSIKQFIQEYKKIKNIEFKKANELYELQKVVLEKKSFAELKELQSMATSMVEGVALGAMAGSLTAFGACGAVGMLGTASTGTAISILSGVAAKNATLAFLGGGALAAQGLGIAGGTAVLGGLVAGPALLLMGATLNSKTSANLDRAYTNYAKAKEYSEEMDTASKMCIAIRKKTNMFYRFLLSLNSVFEPLVYDMKRIIKEKGTDFPTYTKSEKETFAEAYAIAGAIKAIIDTPILDNDGRLTQQSEGIIDTMNDRIKKNMK